MAKLLLKSKYFFIMLIAIILLLVFSAFAIQSKNLKKNSFLDSARAQLDFSKKTENNFLGSSKEDDREISNKSVAHLDNEKNEFLTDAENKKITGSKDKARTISAKAAKDLAFSSDLNEEFSADNLASTNNSFPQSENPEETHYLKNFLETLGLKRASGISNRQETELPTAELNKSYCTTLLGINTPGDPFVAFMIVQGFAPKGLFLDRSTGALCGTPAEKGIFYFTVQMDNSSFSGEKIKYRLVVTEAATKEEEGELKINTLQLAVGKIGAEYTFQLQASGGEKPYFWLTSGLPDGLELDSSGIIGGSPAKTGEYQVLISVQDSSGRTASLTLPLVIRTTPVFITSSSLGEGVIDEPFQARLSAQGGVPPYSWELLGPELPEGMTFSSINGVIEGTPQKSFSGTVSVKVQDSENKSDSADLILEIREHSLKITNESLGDSFVGTFYSFTLSAEGGTAPYNWSEVSGRLPNGLGLDESTGAIMGTPATKGEFDLIILVSDSNNKQAKKSFVLRISDPTLETSPPATPSPTPEKDNSDSTTTDQSTATPTPLPPAITNFIAIPSDKKVGLVWQNPSDPLFQQTTIVRTDGEVIEQADQGTLVYSGTNNNALDLDLENDQSYRYFAFAQFSSSENQPLPAEATATPQEITLTSKANPFIDEVTNFSPLDPKCFNCSSLPQIVLGPPQGKGEYGGSTDAVSIGAKINDSNGKEGPYGGSITLKFNDNIVFNGPGADFTIFENAFRLSGTDDYFVEPAVIEVSVDGIHFYRFPFDFVPHYDSNGALNLFNPFCYAKGFAGTHPVYSNNNSPSPLNTVLSGGDSFDLNDLPGAPLSWIRFIRITSTGDNWLTDLQGEAVRHSNKTPYFGASGKGNSGFDLDAITAINF